MRNLQHSVGNSLKLCSLLSAEKEEVRLDLPLNLEPLRPQALLENGGRLKGPMQIQKLFGFTLQPLSVFIVGG